MSIFVAYLQFQVAARGTSPDMTAVLNAWSYGKVIETLSNLRRKKFHRTVQGSNFLVGSFSNRDNVRDPIQFSRKNQPKHLKNHFSSRADPSIFT